MAFDFNNNVNNSNKCILDETAFTKFVAERYNTDCIPFGDNTGREYLEEIGYFDANEKFYMVDPKPYLMLFPAASKNFGISIWEPGNNNTFSHIDEIEFERPQLVFQQVYCDITNSKGVVKKGQLLHYFRGIYKVTRKADGELVWEKLWNVFIFDPQKEYRKA